MLHQGEAGEQAPDKARAGRRAGRFESLRLRVVHQQFGRHVAPTGFLRVTQRQREFGKAPIIVLGEVNPRAHLRRIKSQRRRVFAFADAEIVEAAGIGKSKGLTAPLNAVYMPLASIMVVPINVASPWT